MQLMGSKPDTWSPEAAVLRLVKHCKYAVVTLGKEVRSLLHMHCTQ